MTGAGWVKFYRLWLAGTARESDRGYPDLHGIFGPKSATPGRYWALEVKRKSEKPTSEQLEFLDAVKSAGAFGAVVYSLDDARRIFEDAIDGKS